MKKALLISLGIITLVLHGSLFANSDSGLKVRVQVNRTVYFYEESIPVHFTISNQSEKLIPLKLSKYAFLNYEIEVFTLRRVSVKEKDEFFSRRFNVRGMLKKQGKIGSFFQNMSLNTSQIMGTKVDLMRYFRLPPGEYIIRGKFYPVSSFFNPSRFLVSPYVRLIVKEDLRREKEKIKERKELRLKLKQIITPQDSIRAFFSGKIKKEWESFFYVIDLRRLIKQFSVFYKSFRIAADQEKNQVVRDFKRFLKELNSDERIISFDIIETVIRKKRAIAKVIVSSRWKESFIKREYRFGLIKKDHWYIYGYTVIQK